MCIFNIVIGVWAFVIMQMQLNMHVSPHPPKAGQMYRSTFLLNIQWTIPTRSRILDQILKIQLFIIWREKTTILIWDLK